MTPTAAPDTAPTTVSSNPAADGATAGSGAQLIESDNAGDALSPQIAFDANGNAIAVWKQSDGTPGVIPRYNIWSNRFSAASGTWGTAQLIETDDARSAGGPQIALDPSGNAIAVWAQWAGMRYDIWANRFSAASGTWGTAELVETDTGNAYAPEIAVDANGNAIAVWIQSDTIWANRFSAASGTWGTARLIQANDEHALSAPQIAFDASGNAMAVWRQHESIWVNRFSAASGNWGTAQTIDLDNGGVPVDPQIAFDPSGNAIAVWHEFDAGRADIWAARFSASSGTWGTAQLIETDNDGSAEFPRIALDASGNAIAVWSVWYRFAGTHSDVWANRYSAASGTWGTPELIESGTGNAFSPQVAFDPSGNATAVWQQFSDTRIFTNVWFNRFSAANGTWATAQLLETDGGGGAQIAFDTRGNAIVVWMGVHVTHSNGFMILRNDIWAKRFEKSSGD